MQKILDMEKLNKKSRNRATTNRFSRQKFRFTRLGWSEPLLNCGVAFERGRLRAFMSFSSFEIWTHQRSDLVYLVSTILLPISSLVSKASLNLFVAPIVVVFFIFVTFCSSKWRVSHIGYVGLDENRSTSVWQVGNQLPQLIDLWSTS